MLPIDNNPDQFWADQAKRQIQAAINLLHNNDKQTAIQCLESAKSCLNANHRIARHRQAQAQSPLALK